MAEQAATALTWKGEIDMIGTTIANYRIDEKIGEGGMGEVYKAVDLDLERIVAIKVISADLSKDPGLMERFRAEAKAQAHLNHTNIASLYSLLSAGNHTAIVMEYLEGETLDQMLHRRGLIPEQEAVPLFRQALLGVGFAHRMGIVHRDIKPSNIMVNKYGVTKVMDFGIAKVLGGQRLTRTGTQVGTAAYMSPEQIRNRPVEIRSDIYSLGVTLYELLTAHLPFESESEFEVMTHHVTTPPPAPTRYYPYISRGIEQCVLMALEKDPAARFQTVEEFGSALEHPDGIEQWLAARPAKGLPPMVAHTGGTPPPSSMAFAASATGITPTPELRATVPPFAATPSPLPQPPPPPSEPASASPSPGPRHWFIGNRPSVAVGAGVLLICLCFGSYALFSKKPSNNPSSSASGTSAGPSSSYPLPFDSKKPSLEQLSASGGTSIIPPQPVKNQDAVPPTPSEAANPLAGNANQALQKAQLALNNGRLFRPSSNSAFYWAKQAEEDGSPDAAVLERKVTNAALRQIQQYRDSKNFSAAASLLNEMIEANPGKNDLLQLKASIQTDERNYQQQLRLQQQQADLERQRALVAQQQAEAERQRQLLAQQQAEAERQRQLEASRQTTAPPLVGQGQVRQPLASGRFVLIHRHVSFNTANSQFQKSFCAGTLTILPSGAVQYDCVQSQDGRCDHITIPGANIKQIKIARDGELHIATKGFGNWDFTGQAQQINAAYGALNRFVGR